MTFEEKLKADGHRMTSRGCPSDYGYEEQESYSTHCSHIHCEECWKREMKEKENENVSI